ncbi:MAG: alpha/beta fold hydrolase [Myxococcaceae bacterium]|nr:MAG: alpha/beta fold hydrolase [Myxococcaceae bacterium]
MTRTGPSLSGGGCTLTAGVGPERPASAPSGRGCRRGDTPHPLSQAAGPRPRARLRARPARAAGGGGLPRGPPRGRRRLARRDLPRCRPGVPVVFVHGRGGNHHFFEPQIAYAENRARVMAYDQRGCGDSSLAPRKKYDLDTLVRDSPSSSTWRGRSRRCWSVTRSAPTWSAGMPVSTRSAVNPTRGRTREAWPAGSRRGPTARPGALASRAAGGCSSRAGTRTGPGRP